jgi:hypothetical protein
MKENLRAKSIKACYENEIELEDSATAHRLLREK